MFLNSSFSFEHLRPEDLGYSFVSSVQLLKLYMYLFVSLFIHLSFVQSFQFKCWWGSLSVYLFCPKKAWFALLVTGGAFPVLDFRFTVCSMPFYQNHKLLKAKWLQPTASPIFQEDCFYSLNKKWIKVKVKSLASSSVELNANIDVHAYIQKV